MSNSAEYIFPKVVLVVLDGFGVASPSLGNAVTGARPVFLSELVSHYPTQLLQASGPAVGLPWGERGNSEVGHLTIGAGRVVTQELSRINASIADGSFYENSAFIKAMDAAIANNSTLHIAGLIGGGGVHAYEQHLYSLLGMAANRRVPNVAVHVFTDGRDAPSKAALEAVQALERRIQDIGVGRVASITGRFYAMDRGGHWEQTQATLNAMLGSSQYKASSATQALTEYYAQGLNDEMIPPTVLVDETGSSLGVLSPKDAVIFFNYRNDRMIQLTKLLLDQVENVVVATMTSYDPALSAEAAFPPLAVPNSLGEVVSKQNWKQFRAAESEKFAHVTFFFNGQRHEPWPGEDRIIVQSPAGNTKNYEDVPAMSAYELTEAAVKRIREDDDHFVFINYANCDMVGHTGSLSATQKAILAVDDCLQKVFAACQERQALMLITADHGNCESMIAEGTGEIDKEHSSNPIPFITVAETFRNPAGNEISLDTLAAIPPSGILADIAPTVLYYLGLEKPAEMTGSALIAGV
jgi:2,3-bisphosphoglycerate-independent phosphoglycerate mutase